MAITIVEVLGEEERGVRARVRHEGSELTALVVGDIARAVASPEPVIVEMDYEAIRDIHILSDFDDAESGIRQGTEGSTVVTGRVLQVVEDDEGTFVDLYLRTGAEFLLFRASDAGVATVSLNAGVELVVDGLRFLL